MPVCLETNAQHGHKHDQVKLKPCWKALHTSSSLLDLDGFDADADELCSINSKIGLTEFFAVTNYALKQLNLLECAANL